MWKIMMDSFMDVGDSFISFTRLTVNAILHVCRTLFWTIQVVQAA